jgi:malonyl-CoA O-methyltransferase
MLERCQTRLGHGPLYGVMDGEAPEGATGPYNLIASSLAMQWFTDLPGSIARLLNLLAPGGRLVFATLGNRSFNEWQQAHAAFGLASGLHDYPGTENFPLPPNITAYIEQEMLAEHHPSAQAFLRALKTLGAGTPRPGHRPLPAGAFRQLLAKLDGRFTVSYHILYVEINLNS